MKKILVIALLILVLSALISGSCAKPTPAPSPSPSPSPTPIAKPSPSPTPSPTPAGKTKVLWAYLGPGVGAYSEVVALIDLLNKKSNLSITLTAVGGANDMFDVVAVGQADLSGPATTGTFSQAYLGLWRWKGKPLKSLRLLLAPGYDFSGFWTVPRTNVTSLTQIKGLKVAEYPTTGAGDWYRKVLEFYGYDVDKDVKWITVEDAATACKEMAMGRVDVAHEKFIGKQFIELKEAAGRVVALPVDPDKLAAAKKKYSELFLGMMPGKMPPGAVAGIDLTQSVDAVIRPTSINVGDKMPDEVAYQLAKAMLENQKEIAAIGPRFKYFKVEESVPIFEGLYHPGAIKAFKEKGLWTKELEQNQQDMSK